MYSIELYVSIVYLPVLNQTESTNKLYVRSTNIILYGKLSMGTTHPRKDSHCTVAVVAVVVREPCIPCQNQTSHPTAVVAVVVAVVVAAVVVAANHS